MAERSAVRPGQADAGDRLDTPLVAPETPRAGAVLALERRRFDFSSSVAVVGIVNRTPDSFYDRGATYALDAAIAAGRRMVSEGAAILDVGAVKAGPGPEVSAAEEQARLVPVVEALRADSDVVISADTFRATVADAALLAGADLVNDISGGADPEMLDVVADHGAGYLAVHRGGPPRSRPFRRGYRHDVVTEVVAECAHLAEAAIARGVRRDRIVVDPGHDFNKTTYHSLAVTRRLPEVAALGYPLLVALSNKDFVGETLDAPLEGRVDASIAAAVFAVVRGANLVRVHEVARTVAATRMVEALLGWRPPAVPVRGLE